jgi:selenocysteine lyase/cysteine desulfurase
VDYSDEYQPGARRFDQGQRTLFELTPMAIAVARQLLAWGIDTVAATLRAVTDTIIQRLTTLNLATIPRQRGPHLLGVELPGAARAQILPALTSARCYAAIRGSSLRLSPHLHTTPADIDRLTTALAAATS